MDDSYQPAPGRSGLRILPILVAAALIGFTVLRGCQQGPFGRRQIVGMGPQQEAALGAQAYTKVLSQSQVVQNDAVVEVVRGLAKDLVQAANDPNFVQYTGLKPPDFQWECNVVRSNEVNAFCLPGGKIVVYTGILPVAVTESALAAVMGHEIGHALAHHGAERMAQQQIVQLAETGAAGALSDMDPQRQREVIGLLGAGSKFGVLLPFSRKHESEADRIGMLLMAAAGRDPRKAVEFWERMAKTNPGGQPPEFMSTHPSHERRIQDLEALLSEATPFYERAARQVPDRPLPLAGSARSPGPTRDGGERDDWQTAAPREAAGLQSSPKAPRPNALPPNAVPEKVALVLKFIDHNDRAPEGFVGGRTFMNLGKDGEQSLPRADARGVSIRYREWDVNRKIPGRNRGAERLITGSDRSAFYTSDHYRTFTRIR